MTPARSPLVLCAVLLLSVAPGFAALANAPAPERARLIVLSDIGHDPDDEQQITHLLACSSEVEIEGLIAVTGRFFRRNPTDSTKWLMPHLIHRLIDGYGQVYPNLQLHATGWPTPEHLHGIVANGQTGNGMLDVGAGRWSRGSRLIVAAVSRPDSRPLHIVLNAGANTLAQALFELRATNAPAQLEALIAKFRVFDNGGQDEAGAWICHEFPSLHYVRSVNQNRCYGGPSNRDVGPNHWMPQPRSPAGQDAWAEENIRTGHGALGALYSARTIGGTTAFIEGGGTIPWMRLVSHGLTDPSEPSWGGWSGRYTAEKQLNVLSAYSIVRPDEQPYLPFRCFTDQEGVSDHWTDPEDGQVYDSVSAGVWRWRQAMWNDFKARMDWCVQPYAKANHHPVAALNGDTSDAILKLTAKPGEVLKFDASGSTDPDKDALCYSWWIYPEAGQRPYGKALPIENATAEAIALTIPRDAAGKELHLILEVWDRSRIVPLVDYRHVVISIAQTP